MKLTDRRIVGRLICLTIPLLLCAAAPMAAQQGIDLLDPEQVLRGASPRGTVTVQAEADEGPVGVGRASHETVTIRYDDGEFENFEEDVPSLLSPRLFGLTEVAQRFEVDVDSEVVSARVCFLRPEMNGGSRAVDFKLYFYSDENDGTTRDPEYNPGGASGLTYIIDDFDIRVAGDYRCGVFTGALVGKDLDRGAFWLGVEWETTNRKILGEDHYTEDDEAETGRDNEVNHETEVRYRNHPVAAEALKDGWLDPRDGNTTTTTSGLKAVGIRLTVAPTHAEEPDPGDMDDDGDGDDMDDDDMDDQPGAPDPNPGIHRPPPAGEGYSTCRPTVAPLTFEGGIKVSLCYDTKKANEKPQDAKAVYQSGNSGLLYFFEPDNAEVFVKVLNGCKGNGHRWVYVAALTDVAFNMNINDGRNPTVSYWNKSGGKLEQVQDQMAFKCP